MADKHIQLRFFVAYDDVVFLLHYHHLLLLFWRPSWKLRCQNLTVFRKISGKLHFAHTKEGDFLVQFVSEKKRTCVFNSPSNLNSHCVEFFCSPPQHFGISRKIQVVKKRASCSRNCFKSDGFIYSRDWKMSILCARLSSLRKCTFEVNFLLKCSLAEKKGFFTTGEG